MITVEKLTVDLCRANPDFIFVFGDNMLGKGCAGQANIRYEPNAIGIPSKRLPSMKSTAFFSDRKDEFKAVTVAIRQLVGLRDSGKAIIFPASGIGTGLARMETKSPKLFSTMQTVLDKAFPETLS